MISHLRGEGLRLLGAVDCVRRCTIRSSPPSHVIAKAEILMLRISWPSLLVLQAVRMWVLSWKLARTGMGSLTGIVMAFIPENERAYG